MSNREILLRQLSSAQFSAWELSLYLKTNPNDVQALKMYSRYKMKYNKLKKEFEEKYGPILSEHS